VAGHPAWARRPLLLAPNLVRRFYRGGGLVRAFRHVEEIADSWWSEDWIGSCVETGGAVDSVAGSGDGLSSAAASDGSSVLLRDVIAASPEAMLGSGPRVHPDRPDLLVKLVSAATRVPMHAHPGRSFAKRYLGSPFGKTEAWVILAATGEGAEAPYVGVGLQPGVGRAELADLVRRQDHAGFAAALVRRVAGKGEVYLIPAGTPHFFGPQILVLNVQEPSDHTVLAEWDGAAAERQARMGLDWDTAIDAFELESGRTPQTPQEALQPATRLRSSADGAELRLVGPAADEFFDITRLEVTGQLPVADGRFYIGVVVGGSGTLEFDGGTQGLTRGDAYVCPATLPHLLAAGSEPLAVIRCLESRLPLAAAPKRPGAGATGRSHRSVKQRRETTSPGERTPLR
jgi:mannose-6-phosphate isomerase